MYPLSYHKKCDRCDESLNNISIMSWFTTETICMNCSDKENKIKKTLREKGITNAMEGCGFVPDPNKYS